jgi:ribosomal protein S18 acetylase RimI-like enzyme
LPGTRARILDASPADAAEIAAFSQRTYAAAFGASFRPADLAHHVTTHLTPEHWQKYLARDRVLLARDTGGLVGYVQFGPCEAPGEVEIRRLYVDAPAQGQGFGTRLLAMALEHPDIAAASAVWIDVWENNPAARRLYERFGFVKAGRKPFVLHSGDISGYDVQMVRRRS